jgi:uncharacterized protein (TIGR03084 family)
VVDQHVLQESRDLRAEAEELHAFLETLRDDDWSRPTGFLGWTPWDVVAHLHFFDEVSLLSLEGRDPFVRRRDELVRMLREGRKNKDIAREQYGRLGPADLLATWIAACRDLASRLGESDAKSRLPWFGPDMGVRMFTTARQMETWAHGQEIYDLLGATRPPTDRLKGIAHLGVVTFGWTFANRGLEAPGSPPHVRLVAPSGAVWEWNEPSERDCVRGDALDFCQVVTQTRNVADVKLDVRGDTARRWMAIAQCFAGGPADPPKPGERGSARQ